jgi:serine/threonine-protein kinase
LIAIASNEPLIAAAAAAATDGTPAATLLPLIEAEIAGRADPRAGASIGVFSLSP